MNSLTLRHKVSHNRQTTFSCDVTILIFSLTGNKKGQNDNMGLRTTHKRIKLGLMQRYLAKVIYECGCLQFFVSDRRNHKKLRNSVKFLYRGGSRSPTGSTATVSNSWKWLYNVSAIYQQLIRHFQS